MKMMVPNRLLQPKYRKAKPQSANSSPKSYQKSTKSLQYRFSKIEDKKPLVKPVKNTLKSPAVVLDTKSKISSKSKVSKKMYDYKPKLLGLLESENPFALAKKEKPVPQTTKSKDDKKQMF
jgi:hypothetical protein